MDALEARMPDPYPYPCWVLCAGCHVRCSVPGAACGASCCVRCLESRAAVLRRCLMSRRCLVRRATRGTARGTWHVAPHEALGTQHQAREPACYDRQVRPCRRRPPPPRFASSGPRDISPGPAREPKPEWLKVRAPGSPNYLRLKALMQDLEPEHRLRGSALPEHRRVLAPRHGDVHDPRRRLHARLRLLRGAARQARATLDAAEPGARRRRGRARCDLQLRRHHLGRSRRPRRRRRVRSSPRRSGGSRARRAGLPHRSADPRLPGHRGAAAHGARRRPGRPEPQHRDRAAALPHGASGRHATRARWSCSTARARYAPRHPDQDRPDGRPRRGAGRARRDARAICAASASRSSPSASTCGRPSRTCRWCATTTPTSSPS